MKLSFYISFLLLLNWSMADAQHFCLYNAEFIHLEHFPTNPNSINLYTEISFQDNVLQINTDSYPVEGWTQTPFSSKNTLHKRFSCLYEFEHYADNISGTITAINLVEDIPDIGQQIQYITFSSCGSTKHFILTDYGFYNFSNKETYRTKYSPILIPHRPYISTFVKKENLDTSNSFTVRKPAVYDTMYEEVIVKPFYRTYQVSEPSFGQFYQLLTNETSNCSNAIMDTTMVQFLLKEGWDSIIVDAAVFETITEEVLAYDNLFDSLSYIRTPVNPDTFIIHNTYELKLNNFNNINCSPSRYLPCLDYTITKTKGVFDSTYLGVYYPTCKSTYLPIKDKCVKIITSNSPQYTTRQYEKKVSSTHINTTHIPTTYQYLPKISITNKNELDPDCIQITESYIPFDYLINDSTIETTVIPAQYKTRQYYKIVSIPTYDFDIQNEIIDTVIMDDYFIPEFNNYKTLNTNTCNRQSIIQELYNLGYLATSSPSINSLEYYKAISKFQIDNNLPIGVLDIDFLIKIGLK